MRSRGPGRGTARTPRRVAIAAAVLCLCLAAAPGARAATEVGNDCQGASVAAGHTVAQFAKAPGGTLPITVPRAGVVTSWRVSAAAALTATQIVRLKVLRTAAGPGAFETGAESGEEIVHPGRVNAFEARIPVSPGDRFGAYGAEPYGPLLCSTSDAADTIAAFKGAAPAGTTNEFSAVGAFQVAVSASIEPDADRDGYGDETQDRCPGAATLQDGCPPVRLDVTALARKASVLVLAATSVDAPVTVAGAAGSIRLRAKPKLVAAGSIGRIALRFPRRLKAALRDLPAGKSLKLRIEASAADANGDTSDDAVSVRLRGRGRA